MSFKPALLHFKFDNFTKLGKQLTFYAIKSETQVDCNGRKWHLRLLDEKGWIVLYLFAELHDKDGDIDARFNLSVRDGAGKTRIEYSSNCTFAAKDNDSDSPFLPSHCLTSNPCGIAGIKYSPQKLANFCKLVKRSEIIDKKNKFLTDNSLHIDVSIQVKLPDDESYQPENPVSDNMLALLESGTHADVLFKVESDFYKAHSLILYANAPIIAELLSTRDESITTIDDISSEVFAMLLEFIYAGELPEKEVMLMLGKELIQAANKFELVGLKIAVETALVQSCVIDKENVVDYILFSDAMVCPLLKEYAFFYFSLHAEDILNLEHSTNLFDSVDLVKELLVASATQMQSKSVTELRKALAAEDLDVDGSVEVLTARLANHIVDSDSDSCVESDSDESE